VCFFFFDLAVDSNSGIDPSTGRSKLSIKSCSDFIEVENISITNISRMEKIIYNELKVDDSTSAVCPYVLIGSKLELENVHTASTEEIQIVSPFTGIIDFEVASASYLSPIGKAFLLRKVNDTVRVETPMGVMHYRINAIKPPDDIPQFY
jgi:transcription elongation GreA/GreB family factor